MTVHPAHAEALALSPRRRNIALWVVLLAFFMDLLDTTIVNVAIPSIQASLGATYSAIQWIVAGYTLAFALFLITGGRLGDIVGYKTMFLFGMAAFTTASALCGLAWSTEALIAARVLQGIAAAVMVPQILSTIQVMFRDPVERQGISAFYGALGGLASISGPILGALLLSANLFGLGWRLIFLVNVPVGILAIIAGALTQPNARSPHPLRLDLAGVGMTVLAMFLLVFPLIQGRELGWPAWTVLAILASLPVFVAFWFDQRRKEKAEASPLVVTSLFHRRSFLAGILISGIFTAAMSGFFLTVVLFLQQGLGYSPLKAGLSGIPFSLAVSVAAGLSGPVVTPQLGRLVLTIGSLTMAAGLVFFLAAAWIAGPGLAPWMMILPFIVAGIGMGFIVAPIFAFVLANVPIEHAGSASGIASAVSQVGGAMGVAVIGIVFFGSLDGTQNSFLRAFALSTGVEVAGLVVISALTFLLPRWVRPPVEGPA